PAPATPRLHPAESSAPTPAPPARGRGSAHGGKESADGRPPLLRQARRRVLRQPEDCRATRRASPRPDSPPESHHILPPAPSGRNLPAASRGANGMRFVLRIAMRRAMRRVFGGPVRTVFEHHGDDSRRARLPRAPRQLGKRKSPESRGEEG